MSCNWCMMLLSQHLVELHWEYPEKPYQNIDFSAMLPHCPPWVQLLQLTSHSNLGKWKSIRISTFNHNLKIQQDVCICWCWVGFNSNGIAEHVFQHSRQYRFFSTEWCTGWNLSTLPWSNIGRKKRESEIIFFYLPFNKLLYLVDFALKSRNYVHAWGTLKI